jgi:ribonuclease Z
MLTRVEAGPYTIRGISVGGVYTSLHVRELDVLLDVGIAPRSFGSIDDLFLSHGHADHVGAITAYLGLRGLIQRGPPRVFLPEPIADDLVESLGAMSRLQRYDLHIDCVRMKPGMEVLLKADLWVRALPTFHPVPSLGYQFFRRVKKLRPEFANLPGAEIGKRREAGDESLFVVEDRLELAYVTDTLVSALDVTPSLGQSRVLIVECSFLDERKSLEASRAGCHIHLDELLERIDFFENERVVLMHFSQIYKPDEVRAILAKRCPKRLHEKIVVFAPKRSHWPG